MWGGEGSFWKDRMRRRCHPAPEPELRTCHIRCVLICALIGGCAVEIPSSHPPPWGVDFPPASLVAAENAHGAPVLEDPVGATRLSDGTIVVADRMASSVTYFDSSGRLIRRVGGHGEGPLEFGNLTWLGRCGGDTIFVWDDAQHEMTVLDSRGMLVREFRVPMDSGPALPPDLLSCSNSGVLAFLPLLPGQSFRIDMKTGEGPWLSGSILLVDTRGRLVNQLEQAIPLFELRPLGRVTKVAVSSRYVYVATNGSDSVRVYELGGQRLPGLRLGLTLQAPSRRNYESAIEEQVKAFANAEVRRAMMKQLLSIPMPDYAPPITDLFAAEGDTIWAQVSPPGAPNTRLLAFTANDGVVAQLDIAMELRVFEVGQDYLVALGRDESEAPRLAVYRLVRGLGSRDRSGPG